MIGAMTPPTAFVIKIASRCNLACDYCYVYSHTDQSWKAQPQFMSAEHRRQLTHRLVEYATHFHARSLTAIFHGGEPLLIGAPEIAKFAEELRFALSQIGTSITFSLQTNGTLLDIAAVHTLSKAGVWISISLDGAQPANDLHRRDHHGRSSFAGSLRALRLLEENRHIYGGIISVIDPRIRPTDLFTFVASRKPPLWDLLLPDANYERPPLLRDADPTVYQRWLLEAFDLWFDEYAAIRVRLFDSILAVCAGLPSDSEMLGLGGANVLTVETDGSYHAHDVLKITRPGATSLDLTLDQHTIAEAVASPSFQIYTHLSTAAGLATACQLCPEMNACGGGFIPHRYSKTGFANPSIYCSELLSLLRHARTRMIDVAAPAGGPAPDNYSYIARNASRRKGIGHGAPITSLAASHPSVSDVCADTPLPPTATNTPSST